MRYFTFRTLYDEPICRALAAALTVIGAVAAMRLAPLPINLALAVGLIEVCFAGVLFARCRFQKGGGGGRQPRE